MKTDGGDRPVPESGEALMAKESMRSSYDFSNAIPNPYVTKLKKSITIRLSEDVIDYFKSMADEAGLPYQSLINLYLLDCMKNRRRLKARWQA